MKSIIVSLFVLSTSAAFANPIRIVKCKQVALSEALSAQVKSSSVKSLLESDYTIADFNYKSIGNDVDVVIISKNRENGISTSTTYAVKVVNDQTCEVEAQILAD